MTDQPPAPSPAAPGPPPKRAALSRDLSEFLIELSIALHKHAIYPEGHPSLAPAALHVAQRAEALLQNRGTLSLGVARDQLVIEGVATDPKHPVLGELAGRLHRHHLGAVTFYRGLEVGEVRDLLRTLAVEADRTGQPLGLGSAERLQAWPHARLHPLTYERLELVGDREPPPVDDEADLDEGGRQRLRGAQLWIGLARAALAGQLGEDDAPPTRPAVIARAIDEHPRAEGYDQVIVGYLLQIAEELRTAGGESALELRRRTGRLIRELRPDTLRRLVAMGGDDAQRRKFALDATDGMAVDAVIEILKAAADASHQTISHSMVRMLNKLAAHADGGAPAARVMADTGLRDQVRRLLSGWELEDPNPTEYGAVLQRMSQAQPVAADPAQTAVVFAEAERLVRMSLELGTLGPIVQRAVDTLVDTGRLATLLDLLDAAGPGGDTGTTADVIRRQVATPEQVHGLLLVEPPDIELLDRVLAIAGTAAADELLDSLAATQSRTLRRILLERLARFGTSIAPQVLARLDDGRWFVVRNLLALMEEWPEYPVDFSAIPYAIHADSRVRRQALKLQLRLPAEREQAIAAALSDPEALVVSWGLRAVQGRIPPALVPLVARHAAAGAAADVRPLALRALGRCRDRMALTCLLEATDGGRTLLGRPRLPAKSRELLAALRALADGWAEEPEAAAVLARAARSEDPEVRAAVGAGAEP
jgi:hypothetical protein